MLELDQLFDESYYIIPALGVRLPLHQIETDGATTLELLG